MFCTKCSCRLNAVDCIPELLQCGHTYCLKCISAETKRTFVCAACKQRNTLKSCCINKDLLTLMRGVLHDHHLLVKEKRNRCPFHKVDRTKICTKCDRLICEMCFDAHLTFNCTDRMLGCDLRLRISRTLARLQTSYVLFQEKIAEATDVFSKIRHEFMSYVNKIRFYWNDFAATKTLKIVREVLMDYASNLPSSGKHNPFCVSFRSRQDHEKFLCAAKKTELRNVMDRLSICEMFSDKMTVIDNMQRPVKLRSLCATPLARLCLFPMENKDQAYTKCSNQMICIDGVLSGLDASSEICFWLKSSCPGEKIGICVEPVRLDMYVLFAFKLSQYSCVVATSREDGVVLSIPGTEYFFENKSQQVYCNGTHFGSFNFKRNAYFKEKKVLLATAFIFEHFKFHP